MDLWAIEVDVHRKLCGTKFHLERLGGLTVLFGMESDTISVV